MKKIFFLLLFISILFLIFYLMNVGNTNTQPKQLDKIFESNAPAPMQSDATNTQIIDINLNDKKYQVKNKGTVATRVPHGKLTLVDGFSGGVGLRMTRRTRAWVFSLLTFLFCLPPAFFIITN